MAKAKSDRQDERRAELIPKITRAFADLGYAHATTAAIAEICELRENQLYRLWPSKKAMFLAAIEHLYEYEVKRWSERMSVGDPAAAFRNLLGEEGKSRGSTGLHRVAFAGLGEVNDPEIRAAIASLYQRFHGFIVAALKRGAASEDGGVSVSEEDRLSPQVAAWSLIALGTMSNIARELDLFSLPTQRKLMRDVGESLAGRVGD